MEIRLANLTDKEALIALALENKNELQYLNIPVSSSKIEKTIENLFILSKGSYVVFVAETASGELAGGLLASLERYFYSDELQAQLIQWYVKKRFRGTTIAPRLLKAYVEWAKRSGSAKLNRSDKCIIGVFSLGKGAGAGDLYEQIIWAANAPRV